jgi:hypothetical protein
MSLPKINHPVFKVTIPSTKKVASFRPYTVKEEKLLVMMQSSKQIQDIVDVMKQIITNCCVDNIDVNKLAMFDIEYIFVKLRSKSVGETIELVYSTSGEDKQQIKFTVNLDNVEVNFNPNHKQKFIVNDNIGVSMRYPSINTMAVLQDALSKQDADDVVFDIFIDCIENVFDDNQVYKDFSKDEIREFVMSLPSSSVSKIREFFDTMPVLEHTVSIKKKDGSTENVVLRGLNDFFIF